MGPAFPYGFQCAVETRLGSFEPVKRRTSVAESASGTPFAWTPHASGTPPIPPSERHVPATRLSTVTEAMSQTPRSSTVASAKLPLVATVGTLIGQRAPACASRLRTGATRRRGPESVAGAFAVAARNAAAKATPIRIRPNAEIVIGTPRPRISIDAR